MSRRLGQATTQKEEGGINFGWLLAGGAAGVGLYFLTKELFRPKVTGSMTQVMPVPPKATPTVFADFPAVKTRYDQLRDLYHMGPTYKTPQEAITEIGVLEDAARQFANQRQVDKATADALIADMEDFKGKIQDFIQFQESLKSQPSAISGIGYRRPPMNGSHRRYA